jgi:triosephosphate isomerase
MVSQQPAKALPSNSDQEPSMSARRPLALGNWKMNGDMVANEQLMSGLLESSALLMTGGAIQAGFAVPAPYLFQAAVRLKGTGFLWGAQDCSDQANGAFTGEISTAMLQDFEAGFCLVGHSERRARHHETDRQIGAKLQALLAAKVMPVLCVGESLAQREAGQATQVVCEQVVAALAGVQPAQLLQMAVAYEPIWAIGTGKTASAADAQAMHAAIRKALAQIDANAAAQMRILYGGSVKAANSAELFDQPDIDGGLVGGASLDVQEMTGILQAAHGRAVTLGLVQQNS